MALPKTGCTPFYIAMFRTPDAKLRGADISKLSAKYSVNEEWARETIKHWLLRGK